MNPVISQTFAVTAVKPTISVDHIDNYYITEASGIMPAVSDSRWQLVPDGQQVPVPTASAPYLWHKYITYLTDGSALDPIVEFAGSLGQNGFDYDLVPSHSAIIKDANDNLSPANVSCSLIKRNADGSAETQSVVPSGYSVIVYRDNTSSSYTLGSNVSTAGITSVITFVLKYGNIEVERHDLRVIAEGAEGLTGRGIQSQDTRFKATTTNSIPATPTNDNTWNTWSSLASCGYSQSTPYLWKCIKTVYLNGNGTTETEYLVEGPTVWGQDGADAIFIDLDNEMDAIPCDSTGKVTVATTLVTYARLYRGSAIINDGLTAPVAANCKLGSVTPTITPQQDGAYKLEWVFAVNTQLSADRLTASIAIGYASKSYPAVFTANVVKSGAPGVSPAIYQLLLSQNDASFARNSSNQLTPASISIRCGYTKNYNGSIVKHDGDQASDLQNIDGTYNILYRAIAANGSPGNWAWMKDLSSSNFYLVIPNSTTNTAYEFILTTANSASAVAESNIFDRETLPINKDGLNGAPGESALIIDLDNEQDAFGTGYDGKATADITRQTTAKMFYGTTPLTSTLSYTKKYENGSNCGAEVDVTANSETGLVTVVLNKNNSYPNFVFDKTIFIDITGTASGYTDKPKTARFTLQPQAAGAPGDTPIIYQLRPTPSAVSFKRDADGTTLVAVDNVITLYAKKTEGNDSTQISSLSGYSVKWGYDKSSTVQGTLSIGNTKTVSVSEANSHSSIWFELWKSGASKWCDRETIPINKEGKQGEQGIPGSTPFIIDIDNEMTSIPVSQTGDVESQINLSFNLAAYYGSTNVINECTVEQVGSSPAGFTVDVTTDKSAPRITIAASTTQNPVRPAEITELRFRVKHSEYAPTDAEARETVFSIAAVKSGGKGNDAVLYELLPSETAISVGRNADGTYNPSTAVLKCGYTKRVGNSDPSISTDATAAIDGYNIYFRRYNRNTESWGYYYLYTANKSWLNSFNVGTYSKIQFILCKNTTNSITSDANITGLVDRETIPVVADGQKGNQGDNAFVLDIDNEMAAIPVSQSGAVESQKQITFGLQAYYGTSPVLNDCQVSTEGTLPAYITVDTTTDKWNPTVTIAQTNYAIAEIIEIKLKAVHGTYGTRYATFTLCAVKSGGRGEDAEIYQLKPSHTALQFARNSSGDLTGSYTLTCQIQKTVGSTTTNHDSLSGYYIYYGWDGAASPSASLPTSGRSVGTSEAASHTSVVLELWHGLRTASGSVRLDRETIPILKDGSRGPQGEGEEGNGISVDDFYYCLTYSPAPPEPPLTTANGWYKQGTSGCPATPTNVKPYLWQCEHIEYTQNTSMNKNIIKLVQVYNMGTQPNLLEQTAFDSEDVMDKWSTHNGNVIPQARGQYNAWGIFPNSNNYREMLQQVVFSPGEVGKIKAASYYTLSFYARTRRYVNITGTTYGFYHQSIYLKAGTYKLEFNGHCSTNAYDGNVKLNGYLYNSDWSNQVNASLFSKTDKTMTSGVLTVTSAGYYTVGFYSYYSQGNPGGDDEPVTVNWWRIICTSNHNRLDTYCYPSAVSAGVVYFVDGEVKTSAPSDMGIFWNLEDESEADNLGWIKHSVTFLTKSTITEAEQKILFRSFNTYVEICQPKLEECVMATPWCEHEGDNDMHCDHNPCGTWRSGETYYYCNGQRDVVQARVSATNSSKTWYRMRKRTGYQGYEGTIQPYLDTEHWEKANNLKFSIVDAMFAEEIFTDKLTVSKINAAHDLFKVYEDGTILLQTLIGNVIAHTNTDGSGYIGKFTRSGRTYYGMHWNENGALDDMNVQGTFADITEIVCQLLRPNTIKISPARSDGVYMAVRMNGNYGNHYYPVKTYTDSSGRKVMYIDPNNYIED